MERPYIAETVDIIEFVDPDRFTDLSVLLDEVAQWIRSQQANEAVWSITIRDDTPSTDAFSACWSARVYVRETHHHTPTR